MSESPGFSIQALADACGGRLVNAAQMAAKRVSRVAPVHEAGPDAITWISEDKHAKALSASKAVAVIGTSRLLGGDPRGIVVGDPELAIAQVLGRFLIPPESPPPGIHPLAMVDETAELGRNVAVGATAVILAGAAIGDDTVIHEGVSVGKDVRIGRDSVLYDRCVIYDRCEIGDAVIIHAGTVIGADGFGYVFRDGRHIKIPHVGNVVIEDEVEIGANTCIDRGKFGATRIGRGSKIDNLVMIAHNVHMGALCILAGQCGLSGSVRLGKGVIMGGAAGAADGVQVGDGARIAATAIAWNDIPPGLTVSGVPAREHKAELRERSRVRKLPRLFERIAELEKRVAELEAAADHPENR